MTDGAMSVYVTSEKLFNFLCSPAKLTTSRFLTFVSISTHFGSGQVDPELIGMRVMLVEMSRRANEVITCEAPSSNRPVAFAEMPAAPASTERSLFLLHISDRQLKNEAHNLEPAAQAHGPSV